MASFRAHLSPNEETTLRRIALGTLELADVRQADARRLMALRLIEEADGLLIPTGAGLERLQAQKFAPSGPPRQRPRKAGRLPL